MQWEKGLGRIKPTIYTDPRIFGVGNIIVYFDKTPSDIVCPHFWELRWAFGCPFDCAYCYLQGTGRGNKKPKYRNEKKVIAAIDRAFKHEYFVRNPSIFNSGELSDSLMNPTYMKQFADFFETQNKHKLLLLTKSNRIEWLAKNPLKQTIPSFSLNATEVWRRWEKRTPSPQQRIDAASELIKAGYEVRIRIDPIFPVENWKSYYEDLLYLIFSTLPSDPSRITLGTPRGLAKTLMFTKDRSWETIAFTDHPEHTGWGKKAPASTRKEIYQFFYNKLSSLGVDRSKIAICKETKSMWNDLGMEPKDCRCNCIW
jgi:spore photoproduct lyase